MTTALQLVNRVRRELRWGDTSSFAADLDKVILDRVNDAVATLFESWDWDCDIRHDGAILTAAAIDYTNTANLTNGSKPALPIAFADPLDDNLKRCGIPRMWAPGDAGFGNTSFRITSYAYAGATTLTIEAGPGISTWPGTTDITSTVKLFTPEYVLPPTVRKVIAARCQEHDLYLEQSNRPQVFERLIRRIHENICDTPEIMMIGGVQRSVYDTGTSYASTLPYPVTGTIVLVWPAPSGEYVINYSYLLQRTDLAAITDTLTGCDRALEDLVVQLAFARSMQNLTGDFDPAAGVALEERVMRKAQRLHMNQSRDPGRHRTIGSNFGSTSSVDFGKLPRNFGSLPNA